MSEAMIEVRELCCERNGRRLFDGLTFKLVRGELVHLVGPNGAGKTTLLKILSGLYRHYDGSIHWAGRDIRQELETYFSSTLFIGHRTAIKSSLTPLENLQFLCGLEGGRSDSDIFKALAAVGLTGFENALCSQLSAGQSRRVALARLYLTHTKIWLLDEAFTAIDIDSTKALERFLKAKAEAGVTILMTSHHELSIDGVRRLTLNALVSEEAE